MDQSATTTGRVMTTKGHYVESLEKRFYHSKTIQARPCAHVSCTKKRGAPCEQQARWMSDSPSKVRKSSENQLTKLWKHPNRSPICTEANLGSSIVLDASQRNSRRTINSPNSAEFSNAFSRMFCSAEGLCKHANSKAFPVLS